MRRAGWVLAILTLACSSGTGSEPRAGEIKGKSYIASSDYSCKCECDEMLSGDAPVCVASAACACTGTHPERWILVLRHVSGKRSMWFSIDVEHAFYDGVSEGDRLARSLGQWRVDLAPQDWGADTP